MNLSKATPKWKEIIESVDNTLLDTIFKQIAMDRWLPPDPFAFAQFSARRIRVIILGMDPYPKPGQAHGLAFSSCEEKTPASLNRIFNVWLKNGLIKQKPSHNRLDHLAMQGVLLLNSALTVEEGRPGSHVRIWRGWMEKFIARLCEVYPDATWLLWGNDAQSFDVPSNNIMRWCHPVAMTRPSFSECDHFTKLAPLGIIWSCDETETDLFTDGACSGNHLKSGRVAGAGVVCTRGILVGSEYDFPVPETKVMYKGEMQIAQPSNIRAEGTAILRALQLVARHPDIRFNIYTDSQYWIDAIFSYIPHWIAEEIAFTEKKNADLTKDIYDAWRAVESRCKIIFVDSHHSKTPKNPPDPYLKAGNLRAELAAQRAIEDK